MSFFSKSLYDNDEGSDDEDDQNVQLKLSDDEGDQNNAVQIIPVVQSTVSSTLSTTTNNMPSSQLTRQNLSMFNEYQSVQSHIIHHPIVGQKQLFNHKENGHSNSHNQSNGLNTNHTNQTNT